MEILVRLSLAVLLSLLLALFLAWSWDHSEPLAAQNERSDDSLSTTIHGR